MLRHVGQGGPPLLGRSRACRRQALSCQEPIFFRLAAGHGHHLVGTLADQRGTSLLVPEDGPNLGTGGMNISRDRPRVATAGPPYDATAAGAARKLFVAYQSR